MKEIDFLSAVGKVDKRYIEECVTYNRPGRMRVWVRNVGAVAACLLLAVAAVLIVNHMNRPVVIEEDGFYIEDGVLLRYSGTSTEIIIPDTVKTISDFVFLENANTKEIQTLVLGANVQKVEMNAFAGLEHLTDIVVSADNLSFVEKDGLVMSADGSTLLRYEREGETHFVIPDSVRFVAAHAVQGTGLEEIVFGKNLESIGYNAFASNTNLKAIYLPESLKYISEEAFSDCRVAVDGYVPESAELGENAFSGVPFYLSKLAGQMSPLEERVRGLITKTEGVQKSNLDAVMEQIGYTIAGLRGEIVVPTDEMTRRAYAVGLNAPEIPEGMVIPEEVTPADTTYMSGTYIYDVDIYISAGEYTLVLQAIPENLNTALYWEDVVYRVLNLFYMRNPDSVSPEETVSAFGWTAVVERSDLYYGNIAFTHEDGRVVYNPLDYQSAVCPVITFSPNGTRAAVEYRHENGYYSFYVVTLNGEILMEPNYSYTEYLSNYYGQYVKGSLFWADEDNIEGRNEYGWFRYNIHDAFVIQLENSPAFDTIYSDLAPFLTTNFDSLPEPAGDARIKYSIVGGSAVVYPEIYVFEDDLNFYLVYPHTDISASLLSLCTLSLPDGYTAGRIISVTGGQGGGEFRILVTAKIKGLCVVLEYLFRYENFPSPEFVMLHTPSVNMLSMPVADLEKTYGKLILEYSEHGPGQPVYSVENMEGVYFVFSGFNMYEPLEADMVPTEIIVTGEVSYAVNGITTGKDISEFIHILDKSDAEVSYSVMNGTVQVKMNIFGAYLIEYTISSQDLDLPDEVTATADDWQEWAEGYLRDPSGKVMRIRLSMVQ